MDLKLLKMMNKGCSDMKKVDREAIRSLKIRIKSRFGGGRKYLTDIVNSNESSTRDTIIEH